MKRNQTLFTVLLTIVALGFIVFVAIMQNNFNNPEFTHVSSAATDNLTNHKEQTGSNDNTTDSIINDGAEDDTGNPITNTDVKKDFSESEPTTSTQTVEATTLNARSGPGVEYEINGVLVQGQVVTVEDDGEDWVKIITDEFEGYVNKNYLSGE